MDKKEMTEHELLLKEQRIAFFEKYGEVPPLVKTKTPKLTLGDFYDWYKTGKENFVLLANERNIMSI